MSLPVTANYPQYGSDGNIQFIPKIFAPKMLAKFYEESVIPACANTDYEGQIAEAGDEVVIRTRPIVQTFQYRKGMKYTVSVPTSSPVKLKIDDGEAYALVVDVVDERQADVVLSEPFIQSAADEQRKKIETRVLANIIPDVPDTNKGTAAGAEFGIYNCGAPGAGLALTPATFTPVLTFAGAVLDEWCYPDEDRFFLIPPWARVLAMNSTLVRADYMGGGESTLRQGLIGRVDRFDVRQTNLLPTVDEDGTIYTYLIAGHKSAFTFASQMTHNEVKPANGQAGKEYFGVQVFGSKVVRPEGIVLIYARYGGMGA